MNRRAASLLVLLTIAAAIPAAGQSATEPREFDYFRPGEISHPLVLPGDYSLSKYGRGLYRIDSLEHSFGQTNCIFLTFTAEPPAGTTPGTRVDWKREKATVDTKDVVRLTTVVVNPFPRDADPAGAILTVRIDARSEEIAEKLRGIAEGILAP